MGGDYMTTAGGSYSEGALVEQPAIALFEELGWNTANCFHEFDRTGGSPLGRGMENVENGDVHKLIT